MKSSTTETMTPEEYEQYKEAEKEHLKKLKELKKAVRMLERRKQIRSSLEAVRRSSEDALEAQQDAVDRLAMETAKQEARLELALDSERGPEGALDEDLRRARARALVDALKSSMESGPPEDRLAGRPPARASDFKPGNGAAVNPTMDREDRPDKTIGRM